MQYVFLFLLYSLGTVYCSSVELTIEVKAGGQECFFSTVKHGETIEFEYQVVDGGSGNLDINFMMQSPSGVILVSDFKSLDNDDSIVATEDGDYRMCWDNSISRINSKVIFLSIRVYRTSGGVDPLQLGDQFDFTDSDIYDMAVQDIQSVVERVRGHLWRARRDQDHLRVAESRDRNLAESTCNHVTNWSLLQLSVMVIAGLLQVFMVRSLFETKSPLNRVWRSLS